MPEQLTKHPQALAPAAALPPTATDEGLMPWSGTKRTKCRPNFL
jgi:hypothetical protein